MTRIYNSNKLGRFEALPLAAFFGFGCVSASKYRTLETEHKAKSQTLTEAQAKVVELNGRIDDLKSKVAKLEDERDHLKKSNDELSAQLSQQLIKSIAVLNDAKASLEQRVAEMQQINRVRIPELRGPESLGNPIPEIQAPVKKASETKTPEYKTPETKSPETQQP